MANFGRTGRLKWSSSEICMLFEVKMDVSVRQTEKTIITSQQKACNSAVTPSTSPLPLRHCVAQQPLQRAHNIQPGAWNTHYPLTEWLADIWLQQNLELFKRPWMAALCGTQLTFWAEREKKVSKKGQKNMHRDKSLRSLSEQMPTFRK